MNLLRSLPLLVISVCALSACEDEAPRVLQLNPNTFTVVAISSSSSIEARERALSEAAKNCNMRGMELSAIGGSTTRPTNWAGEQIYNHELRFQCLPHGSSMNAAAPATPPAAAARSSDAVVVIVR